MKIQRRPGVMMVIMILLIGIFAVPYTIEAAGKKAAQLNKKAVTLTTGETAKLSLKNAAKNKTITWNSSNKNVAEVTKKGKVLAKNSELKRLECSDNELTNLDVRKNQLLEELFCYGNRIKKLNLKKNKNLYRVVPGSKVKVIADEEIESYDDY